jgi:hypothetical protein
MSATVVRVRFAAGTATFEVSATHADRYGPGNRRPSGDLGPTGPTVRAAAPGRAGIARRPVLVVR